MFLTKLELTCSSWVYQEVNTFTLVSVIWWYNGFAVLHFQSRSVLANKLTTNNKIPVRNYPLNYLSVKKANWMEDTASMLKPHLRVFFFSRILHGRLDVKSFFFLYNPQENNIIGGSQNYSPTGSARSRESSLGSPAPSLKEKIDLKPVFIFPLQEKHKCPICQSVLRYPVQFEECGHRVCSSCFAELER